jgi:hypothetical protein
MLDRAYHQVPNMVAADPTSVSSTSPSIACRFQAAFIV